MKRLLLILAFLLTSAFAYGQGANTVTINFPGVPSGACSFIMYGINGATGDLYDCLSGSWHNVGVTSGTGTVTSVSGLTPLFTVANASTTPTFSLSNAAGDTVFANCTAGSAAPSYCALVSAMVPPINLASSANGGVTGLLPNANLLNSTVTLNGTANQIVISGGTL